MQGRAARSMGRGLACALWALCACDRPLSAPQLTEPVDQTSKSATGVGCSDPVPLEFGRTLLGSTRKGGRALSASCAESDAPEHVYRFALQERAQVRVVLSAEFDAVLSLRDNCTYDFAEVACNDDFPRGNGSQSRLDETLDPGEYFLIVDGASGDAGDFELFASLSSLQQIQQACEGARPFRAGSTVRGSTRGLPDLFHATCGRGAHAGEHVYRLEVEVPSRLRVLQQTEYDGVLHLRSDCALPATEVACNDDFRGANHSLLTARLEPGAYYLISDGLSKSNSGTYSLRAELSPLDPQSESRAPLASLCEAARALPLFPGGAELDTFGLPSRQKGSCGGRAAPEALYAFEVAERSRLWVRLRDPEFNAVLYLRSDCADAASEVACEQQARVDRRRGPDQPSPRGLNLMVDPGLYYLFVDGFSEGDFGAAQVELELAPEPSVRARCEAAPWVVDGAVVEGDTQDGPQREDGFRASCGGEARAPEDVYRVHLDERSLLRLELESGFDAVLHVRAGCSEVQQEQACNDDAAHDRVSRVDVELAAGDYLIAVDGFGPTEVGPYRLRVGVEPRPTPRPLPPSVVPR